MSRTIARWLVVIFVVALGSVGIGILQPRLATTLKKHARRDEIFVLPPPEQLRVMTLGYRTAGAHYLWAKLVIEHGRHWEEKRAFSDQRNYLDGILALDPEHPTLYEFVDTLLLFTAVPATEDDARLARAYFERGIRERPHDAQVWLRYGEFLAFLAPSFLKNRTEVEQWKHDGALALGRAAELGADTARTLAASTILSKTGEQEVAIKFLQRAYALTDDPETRRQLEIKLQRLKPQAVLESPSDLVEQQWRAHAPTFSRSGALLLGPFRDPSTCAGPSSRAESACAGNWTDATRLLR